MCPTTLALGGGAQHLLLLGVLVDGGELLRELGHLVAQRADLRLSAVALARQSGPRLPPRLGGVLVLGVRLVDPLLQRSHLPLKPLHRCGEANDRTG